MRPGVFGGADYFGNELQYQLSKADGHPNALAFELLADHVARLVLDTPTGHRLN